jgi:hypothetical protein
MEMNINRKRRYKFILMVSGNLFIMEVIIYGLWDGDWNLGGFFGCFESGWEWFFFIIF